VCSGVFVEVKMDFRVQATTGRLIKQHNHVALGLQKGHSIRELKIKPDFEGNPQERPWPSQFFADS
jgi:hypothetical protein